MRARLTRRAHPLPMHRCPAVGWPRSTACSCLRAERVRSPGHLRPPAPRFTAPLRTRVARPASGYPVLRPRRGPAAPRAGGRLPLRHHGPPHGQHDEGGAGRAGRAHARAGRRRRRRPLPLRQGLGLWRGARAGLGCGDLPACQGLPAFAGRVARAGWGSHAVRVRAVPLQALRSLRLAIPQWEPPCGLTEPCSVALQGIMRLGPSSPTTLRGGVSCALLLAAPHAHEG